MSTVTVRAPAKVNLQLSVGALRRDGFHDLATVYQAVSLYDDVTALPGDGLTVSVEGEGAQSVPLDETNLALRAARALADYADVDPHAHLHIHKGIPVAGGMAGGSADAAATLVALDHLWELSLDRSELSAVAAGVGSDVPFALMGHTAIGLGRGEQLSPALTRGRFEWVFALADAGLSTPQVYAELDRLRGSAVQVEPQVSEPLMAALLAGDARALGASLSNDLQRAAVSLRPQLTMTLEVGEEYGALAWQVSGSGPTVAFLANDEEHALDLAVALTSSGVCRTVRRATGPVAGAKVVES
ncbi:MAG: 4-(cytidine 5'-diphospho)-2-C-methyl-D-erythritol kinase [Actinomycetes bacterium]